MRTKAQQRTQAPKTPELAELDALIPVVCAECRVTYLAPLRNTSHTHWDCPRCGPHSPIDPASLPQKTSVLAAILRLLRRMRLPGALSQLALILAVFGVFLFCVDWYLLRNPRAVPRKAAVTQHDVVAEIALTDSGGALTKGGRSADEVVRRVRGNQGRSRVAPSRRPSDVAVSQAVPLPPEQLSRSQRDTRRNNAGPPSPSDAVAQPAASSIAAAGHAATEVATIFELMQHPDRMGQQIEIRGRIVDVANDAVGNVCTSFEVGGIRVRLESEDEYHYRRVKVVDYQGRTFDRLFVDADGPLSDHLRWIFPHDSLRLTLTPGVRFDRFTDRLLWGMIVVDIQPASPESVGQEIGPIVR